MKVQLVSYTPNALELLIYTKNTRLQGEQTLEDIIKWSDEEKMDHLAYMRDTIKSSWEFVDYVFEISRVTRAFTHQLVRTRNASYAQESQRTVDVRNHGFESPNGYVENGLQSLFDESILFSIADYERLIDKGMKVQDARGVLPTNIHTSIMMKTNLRTLHQMAEVRLCFKTQGEYQNVFRAMRDEVIKVHPWAEDFIQVYCVNTGVCCFPRFKECPIQRLTYNAPNNTDRHKAVLNELKIAHKGTSFEANPIAKGGKTS